ncbi:MAG: hypothetical protein P8K10_06620 [Crocinitomicaceae bacterium]|nr:hypothetical protein [Crocinitomicaceae bacterium]
MIQRIIKQYTPILALVLVSFILTDLYIQKISLYHNIFSSFVLSFIFLGSTVLVNFKIKNNPKRFIGNFLVMTTLQLLAFLIYELVLIFQGGNWWAALHALFICLLLIIVQSINLSKLKLESSEEGVE